MSKPHIELAHKYWQKQVRKNDLAIDMTCGNGHDTFFLNQLGALTFAFDIQETAINKTKLLVPNATMFHRSHDELQQISFPCPPQLIVYNLGYLPGGDKSIVTKTGSTLSSLKQALELLADGGAISMMCYPGHEEGLLEEAQLLLVAKELPSKEWTVCHHQWVNRPRAPSLIWIVKGDCSSL
jgi:hypothetical protein